MRFKFNKEIEYLFKKFFIPEKYLLKKRLIRAYKKKYEEELLFLDKIVDKNLESVDVGVYRGVYTFQLAKLSKHVHSFEPNPLIFPYLNKNLKKIVKNITLYNTALSDVKTVTDLKISKRFNTIITATIHKNNLLINKEFITCKVKTERLDDLLANKNIGFIKIDVEGHEKNVLMGSEDLIKKNKPILLVEIEERHSKEKAEDTINFINNLGYKSYFCDKFNLTSTTKLKDFKLKNNYIFLS